MRTLRRFAPAPASALGLALALQLTAPGAARAGDVTYPQLGTQTSVQDTDILAIWRASGPLKQLNASLFSQYVVNGLGKSTFLQTSNALSELSSVQATARTNLGLGTAATAATGVSGNVLCFLNSNCTVTGAETFNAAPAISTGTAAVGSDYLIMRPTDVGVGKPEIYFHKDSASLLQWDLNSYDGSTFGTATLSLGFASITTPGSVSASGGFTGALSGNASTATKWATAQTETCGGDLTGSVTVDGSAGWTIPCVIKTTGVTAATYGDSTHVAQVAINAKGQVTSASAVAISFPVAPVRASAYLSACGASGCTIGGGAGVAHVDHNSVGNYTVFFSSPLPSTNFITLCTAVANPSDNILCADNTANGARTVNSVNLQFVTGSGVSVEPYDGFNVLVISY